MSSLEGMGDGLRVTGKGTSPNPPTENLEKKYKLTIYAHLKDKEDLVGHAFISLEQLNGSFQTRGFYPEERYDQTHEFTTWHKFKMVFIGVRGKLNNDSDYLTNPGGLLAKRTFQIDEAQVKQAQAVIDKYEKTKPEYFIMGNQCAIFALKVLAATGNKINAGHPPQPRILYEKLSGQKLPISKQDVIKNIKHLK